MGAIATAAFAWLATAFVAIVGWIGAALTSAALAQFWQFAAKIAFLYLLNAIVIAALTPLAASLGTQSFGALGNFAIWMAGQIDLTFAMTTLLNAVVVSYGFRMIRHIF